jgi:hypothetical protein
MERIAEPPLSVQSGITAAKYADQGANGFDRSLFRANLALTPTQRVEQLQRAIAIYLEARRAGRTARLSGRAQAP